MEITREEIERVTGVSTGDVSIYRAADGKLKPLYFSDRVAWFSGLSPEDYGKSVREDALKGVVEADRASVRKAMLEAIEKGQIYDGQFRVLHAEKGFTWVHARARVIGEMAGDPVLVTNFMNITIESESYADIIDKSKAVIYVTDAENYQLYYANEAALNLWGSRNYSGQTCYHFIRGADKPCPFCSVPLMKNGIIHVPQVYDPDMHKYFRVACHRVKWFGRDAIVVSSDDITEDVSSIQKLQREKEEAEAYQKNWLHDEKNLLIKTHYDLTDNILIDSTGSDSAEFVGGHVSYDELLERFLNQAYRVQDRERLRGIMDRATMIANCGKGDTHFEFTYCRSVNGQDPVWVTTTGNSFISASTQHVEAYFYSVDVTAAVLEEQIISQLTELGYDYLGLIYPREDRILYYTVGREGNNPVRVRHASYSDFIANNAERYVAEEDLERVLERTSCGAIARSLEGENSFTITYGIISGTGSYYRKALQFAYISEEKDMIFICRSDVTAQHLSEQQQIAELKEAKLAAERAKEAQSSFMSGISHDMRTPLNGIIGFTRLARNAETIPEVRGYLEKIRLSGSLLLDLINDTLMISKITSGKVELQPEPILLKKLTDNVAIPVRESAAEGKVIFTLHNKLPERMVLADRLNIQKILLNLLANAVKFTPEGGSVDFFAEASAENEAGMEVLFIIRDTGIGISREFLPKIYEPFLQENFDQSGRSGNGLGLSIVRQLVSLMHGDIQADSAKGKGTEFRVRLYFPSTDREETGKTADQKRLWPVLFGKKILLCEDNYLNTEIAKALLKGQNMTVVCAGNGKEGAERFGASELHEFDAILMDIRMPEMNGYEAARKIRSMPRSDAGEVPIIAMTADAYQEDVEKCFAAGMNDHVAKPVDPDRLYTALASFFA